MKQTKQGAKPARPASVALQAQSPHRLRLFIIGYIAFFMAVLCAAVFGPQEILNSLNSAYGEFVGIATGALCLSPLLLLKKLTYSRLTARLEPGKLILTTDGRESIVNLDDIHLILLEKGTVLSLYGRQRNLLYSFMRSGAENGPAELVKNFTKLHDFHKETKQVKSFAGRHERVVLTRTAPPAA